jgi:hypothetical protein
VDSPGGQSDNTSSLTARRSAVAATPASPAPTTTITDKPTFGDVWAFRLFLLLFMLTLIVGFAHFLLSYFKHQQTP